jgi:glycosyltransferase involved in cell wall biosynthesis
MEKSPILTIVTINKNNAKNLKRTIASLWQIEADEDVELIFIDGASSDDSVLLAKALWNENQLISEPDSGIYNAMNKGLSLAKGKYVLWLNSGDELVDGVWDEVKQVLQGTDATVVAFGLEIYNESGTKLLERRIPNANMLPRRTLPHPSSMFRRDVVSSLRGYDESFKIAADRFLFLTMYQQGEKIAYFRIVLSKFYLGGISSNFFDTFFENRRIDHHFRVIGSLTYLLILFFKKLARGL